MGVKVTIDDVRRAGHCPLGARRWFEEQGLDFAKFLREGIDEDALAALNNALADGVIRHKKQREGRADG